MNNSFSLIKIRFNQLTDDTITIGLLAIINNLPILEISDSQLQIAKTLTKLDDSLLETIIEDTKLSLKEYEPLVNPYVKYLEYLNNLTSVSLLHFTEPKTIYPSLITLHPKDLLDTFLGIPLKPKDDKLYCIKQVVFFSPVQPVIETNLTKEVADKLCKQFNHEEVTTGDAMYTTYEVHPI